MGTPEPDGASQTLARNVRKLREAQRLSYRDLEAKLRDYGKPILASGLLKLERGDRRTDVDELTALAWVLGPMAPGRLLTSNPEGTLLPAVVAKKHEEAIGRAVKAIADAAGEARVSPRSVIDYVDHAFTPVVFRPRATGDGEADDGR